MWRNYFLEMFSCYIFYICRLIDIAVAKRTTPIHSSCPLCNTSFKTNNYLTSLSHIQTVPLLLRAQTKRSLAVASSTSLFMPWFPLSLPPPPAHHHRRCCCCCCCCRLDTLPVSIKVVEEKPGRTNKALREAHREYSHSWSSTSKPPAALQAN